MCYGGLQLINNIVYPYQSPSNTFDFSLVSVFLLRTTFFTVDFTQANATTILTKCVPVCLGLVDVLFGGGMPSLFLGAVLTPGVWLLPVWAGL